MGLWNHFFCWLPSYALRRLILKHLFFANIGKSNIHLGVKFFSPWKLTIGDGSNIQFKSFLDCRGGLEIGNNVDIALGVNILTQDHDVRTKTYATRSRKVLIDDNVVIGSYALILPGVHLEPYAVIGAGSVVTKMVPKKTIYAGNPAKEIGVRGDEFEYSCSYQRPFH